MTTRTPAAAARFALPSYERPEGVNPPLGYPDYRSTALRAPHQSLLMVPQRLTEVTGPLLGQERVTAADADLTAQHAGSPSASGSRDRLPRCLKPARRGAITCR